MIQGHSHSRGDRDGDRYCDNGPDTQEAGSPAGVLVLDDPKFFVADA